MRKKARRKDAAWAYSVFDRAPYITVGFVRADGTPYCVPLSLVRSGNQFYFHCAYDGEKMDCLRADRRVSLAAVCRCKPVFEVEKQNFTMHYESAMAVGVVEEVLDDVEKTEALRLLCRRFLPKHMGEFASAIERSLSRTCVVRITLIGEPVGKCKE